MNVLKGSEKSLLVRLPASDTLAQFEAAYPDRLRDGRSLLERGRGYWGIYTFGYVVEIVLKAAYARLQGWNPSADMRPVLRSAPARAAILSVGRVPRNLHDLLFWAELLVGERLARGIPFSSRFTNRFLSSVTVVALNWRETMRYCDSVDVRRERQRVSASVTWLVQHYPVLWRTTDASN